MGPLKKIIENPDPQVAYDAAKAGGGATSLCNGALMRITPLAVWAQRLPIQDLEKAVSADIKMTHFKKAMLDIVTAYCIAIKTLIRHAGKENRAILAVQHVEEYGNGFNKVEYIGEWLH